MRSEQVSVAIATTTASESSSARTRIPRKMAKRYSFSSRRQGVENRNSAVEIESVRQDDSEMNSEDCDRSQGLARRINGEGVSACVVNKNRLSRKIEKNQLLITSKSRRIIDLNNLPLIFCVSLLLVGNCWAGYACLSNPCLFGVCIDDLNSTYSCYCIDGYTGVQCQTNWDECWSSPCENGGTCIDGVAAYNCSCSEGFVGQNCEENLDECMSNPCQNGGSCHDRNNGYSCTCLPGYLGTHCETDVAVCETGSQERCHNGGECLEGAGLQYSCKCLAGWQGRFCEDEIDECEPAPCQNGGVCIDKLATFSCACPMGFSGTTCEEEILVCDNSPCRNSALCLMEEGQPVCYCVPDFHGEKCEYQYDECQLGPRCVNGGTCIDGIDDFSCTCPTGLTGATCDCLELETGDLECNYTMPYDIYTSTAATKDYDYTTHDYSTTEYYRNSKGSSIRPSIFNRFTTKNVPTTEESFFTTFSTTTNDIYTSLLTTSSPYPSTSFNFSSTSGSGRTDGAGSRGTTPSYETTNDYSPRSPRPTWHLKPVTDASGLTPTSGGEDTNTAIYTTPDSKHFPRTTDNIFRTTNNMFSTDSYSSQTAPRSPPSPTTFRYDTTTDYATSMDHNKYPITFDPLTTTITPFFTEYPRGSGEGGSGVDGGGGGISSTTPDGTNYDRDNNRTTTYSSFSLGTTVGEVESGYGGGRTTQPTVYTSTDVDSFSGSPDCIRMPCFNGGTCVNTSEGSKCICRFDRHGSLCENRVQIKNAAFAGDSYLSHLIFTNFSSKSTLSSVLPIRVEVKVRTRATDGLILLASAQGTTGGHYMALFLHKGLLQFQFSCGLQTMLLSEIEAPVNNGNELLIQAELDFSRNHSHCNASLRVNDTLAMSGDQPTWLNPPTTPSVSAASASSATHPFKYKPAVSGLAHGSRDKAIHAIWLHLGGAPQGPIGLMNEIPAGQGFTGCLHSLKINGMKKNIFSDALDGFGITECGALACLSNPCTNGGICVEDTQNNNNNNHNDADDHNGDYAVDNNVDENINENDVNHVNAKRKHRPQSHSHFLNRKRSNNNMSERWKCKCPTGYMGMTCEISVCDNNPCQYGGTCVTFPGSGYLCLCPFGKHGHYCEHNLEIAQPSFSGSVKGLSSYIAYPIPIPLEYTLEFSFKIIPTTLSQISLLAFVGQNGFHDEKSDHLAVSFIQGYIMLTWNLGGGPRRIFIQKPIEMKQGVEKQSFLIHVGQKGRRAWLAIDDKINITGNAPGGMTRLDVNPLLYLGGHEILNYSTLPHDIPLHSGFQGCIYDVKLRAGTMTIPLEDTKGMRGRSIGQCATRECHRHACQNEGACLQHGSTFTCICQEGWYGPLCALSHNPCDSSNNQCSKDSTCVPLVNSYECDCKVGQMGRNCDIPIRHLSDVSLTGRRSYLAISWPDIAPGSSYFKNALNMPLVSQSIYSRDRQQDRTVIIDQKGHDTSKFHAFYYSNMSLHQHYKTGNAEAQQQQQNRVQYYSIEFHLRPLSERGLLLFFGTFDENIQKKLGFVSLSLQGGVLEYRVSSANNQVSTVRSTRVLAIGEWHKIKIIQSGKRMTLWVEGSSSSTLVPISGAFIDVNSLIYVGGLPDLSKLPQNSISGFPIAFRGCVRQFTINGKRIILNDTNIAESRNINDCDGTACGGDSCDLDGHCWLDDKMQPRCKCPEYAKGERCEIPESCEIIKCKNNGKCLADGQCSCPNGWLGYYCEISTNKNAIPSFRGNSYLIVPPQRIPFKEKRNGASLYIKPKQMFQIAVNFSTIENNGLILWGEKENDKFLGIGLENGHIKLASNLLGTENDTVDIPAAGFISDGGWHNVQLEMDKNSIQLTVDNRIVFSDVQRHLNLNIDNIATITTEDSFNLGGFSSDVDLPSKTRNKFSTPFKGCIQNIYFEKNENAPQQHDFSTYEGENIGECELYQ